MKIMQYWVIINLLIYCSYLYCIFAYFLIIHGITILHLKINEMN